MKIISLLILLFCLTGSLSSANGQKTSDELDSYLKKIFNYANSHDVKALEELKDKIKIKKDRALTNAFSLALYIASPEKYKRQYVDNFPIDHEGIMVDYYERIELKRLTPSFLYSIVSIGFIAEEGNEKAIEKVLRGSIHSDGIVAEEFCDMAVKIINKQLQKTLQAYSRINEADRQTAYSCFQMMDVKEFRALKSKLNKIRAGATESEIKIISEIENYQ